MNEVRKEQNKFLVIKQDKLNDYFHQFISGIFATKKEDAYINRIPFFKVLKDLKNDNKYIVCNQDEPYAEKVWQTILDGEKAKLNVSSKVVSGEGNTNGGEERKT